MKPDEFSEEEWKAWNTKTKDQQKLKELEDRINKLEEEKNEEV